MAQEHWIDVVSRVTAQGASRRALGGALTFLLAGTSLLEAAAKKRSGNGKGPGKNDGGRKGKNGGKQKQNGKGNGKGKGKRKKKGKGKGIPPSPPPDNGDETPAACAGAAAVCDEYFVGEEVADCIGKCERCRLSDRFCVIEGNADDPTKVATCCFEDQQCCQDTLACCPQDSMCCPGYPEQYPAPCCPPGTFCCASAANGCCVDGQLCCPGVGCVYHKSDPNNCDECGKKCEGDTPYCVYGICYFCPRAGLSWCDGDCVDKDTDPEHCGKCDNDCDGGECVDGECRYCPSGFRWCNGGCVNIRTNPDHCGECNNPCMRSSWSHEICREGQCQCQFPGQSWDGGCDGCVTSEYICCDNLGHHCPRDTACVPTGTNPDGSTRYACDASQSL